MFRTRRWSILSLFVAVMLLACLVPVGSMAGTTEKGPEMGQALQGLLDQQVQEQGVLGMAMAVRLADGTVIGTGSGYSDPSGEEAWSIDTVSAIGSVTKTFTAVVIMQLAEEGKLSIDETIDTWFPKQPNGDRITIRMLLSHTSGLARYISAENVMEGKWNKKWAPMDLVAEANKSGPVGEPGSSDAHYSNTNYVLLGLIVEEVTGNGWAQEVESRIIKPLGLKDTAFLSKEGILDIMVGGYAKKEVGYQNLLEAPWYPHPSTVWSAGAITSTVSELITYASALFKDDLFESRETLEEMLQPLASQDFGGGQLADLGLGLMRIQVEGMTIWGHPGDVPGYAAFIGYDPDTGATVAAIVNTVGGDVIMPSISALQYVSQIQQGEQVPVEPALAQADNIYEDPEGRFTIPLVGDWTQIETDGTYALFELTGRPLKMHIVTVESDDLEVGVDAALRQVGVDPAALVVTLLGGWEKWSLFYYSHEDGKGVTVLGQVKDGRSYLIIATGDEALTANPPDNVMQTVGGFTLAGEEMVLPTTVDEFEAYINSFVGETTPSLSMVIALGKDVIYAKGFGMADGPKDMRAIPDTVYQWGSVTKIATAAAIMQLREKGLLDLDAPVSQYLDYFPAEYPITVRHLLSHSSGLPEPTEFEWVNVRLNGTPLPDPDLVDRTYYEELTGLMFEPGSDSAYVNPDYVTLGQIVAKLSGKPYIQYIQENILTPLRMKTTDFTYKSDAMIKNAAACAVLATEAEAMIATMDRVRGLGDGADFFGETDDQYAWMNPYNPMAGAGGLVGPASEAIRFAQMLLNGGELDGVQILSPGSVALMQEVQLSISGAPLAFGLGWHVVEKSEHPYIEHDGGGPGIAAKVRLYPNEGFAIVLMSNGTGFDRNEVTDAAANVIFSMLGLEKKEPDTSGVPAPTPAVVASEAKIEPPDYQKIIDEVLDDERIGVALLVRAPEFEYFDIRGYVDWENQAPFKKDHLFRIASCTKTFIATLATILHFEGKLDLDHTITSYLPDSITSHIQYADEITIRQLLSHTSGIFGINDNPEYWKAQFSDPTKERTDIEALEFAYDKPAYFEPGAGSKYSNTNYLLAGLILDKVLGYHHSQGIRTRILEPLELDSTFYEQQEEFDRRRLSHGYFDFEEDGAAEDYYDLRIDTGHAGSALVSTVEDMELFIRSLFTRTDFPDASYRKEFLQELTKPGPGASGEPGETGTGLGIMEYNYGYGKGYGHSGGIPGYASKMLYFPDQDVSFAITMNGIDGGFDRLGVLYTLYEDLIGATFRALGVEKTFDEKIAGRLQEGNVYEDPEGRFTIPLVGDWTQVETDGTYPKFALTTPPLDMYIVTAEFSDLEAGMDAALRQVGIDPGALALKDTGKYMNWNLFYYSLGDGKGVTVPAQVKDETTYCLIITGDEAYTMDPSANLVKTVGGFTLAGEEAILPTTVDEFEAYIEGFVGYKPPALSIAIALGSDVIYTKGFGMADGPKGVVATQDTVYQWSSMSKIVSATAIMQLHEKGLLDLDAPVSQYLDYFPAEYPITVRQIESHSSGIPEPADFVVKYLSLEGQPLPDPDQVARSYSKEFTGPGFEPGSASAYSSLNSVILGQIVAEVSGKSYIEYVKENILRPLGMKNTDFTYKSEAMVEKAAAGAFLSDEVESVIGMIDEIRGDGADFVREVDGNLAWMNRFSVFAPAGGGLIGPVTDVIRFLGMHLNGGEFEGVRILSPESVSLMQEMLLSNTGTPIGFGIGWIVSDETPHFYVEHPGSGYGSQALMRAYPNEGFAIVIMSNFEGYDHEGVVDAAANVVFSMLAGQ